MQSSLSSLKLHWKAPLQTKGFLRIIEFVLAIFAFSLVAGFHVKGYVICGDQKGITLNVKYPFTHYSYSNGTDLRNGSGSVPYSRAGSASQFFVTWGVFSMFYCIAALAVYIIFTANEKLENVVDYLVYTDLVFNIIWVLMWFIAAVEWTVAFVGLRSTIDDVLIDFQTYPPRGCSDEVDLTKDQSAYGQAAVASIFGFLCVLVWAANVYWVFIDTAFFIRWRAKNQNPAYSNM